MAEMAEMGFAQPCGMTILTQRRRERRGPAEILLSRWLTRLPTPLRGGVPGKGGGVNICSYVIMSKKLVLWFFGLKICGFIL